MTPITEDELAELEREHDPEPQPGERPTRHERHGYSAGHEEARRRDRIEARERREREWMRRL